MELLVTIGRNVYNLFIYQELEEEEKNHAELAEDIIKTHTAKRRINMYIDGE